MSALLAVSLLALATFTGLTVYVVRVVVSYRIDQAGAVEEPVKDHALTERVDELAQRLDRLTLAMSDGIERVARAENRVQKTVTSARRAVRDAGLEHAGIEAEHEELQPRNAEGIEPLPALPAFVEPTRTVRIPGGEITIGGGN